MAPIVPVRSLNEQFPPLFMPIRWLVQPDCGFGIRCAPASGQGQRYRSIVHVIRSIAYLRILCCAPVCGDRGFLCDQRRLRYPRAQIKLALPNNVCKLCLSQLMSRLGF